MHHDPPPMLMNQWLSRATPAAFTRSKPMHEGCKVSVRSISARVATVASTNKGNSRNHDDAQLAAHKAQCLKH